MFMYLLRNKIFELEHIDHIDSTFYLRDHDDDMTNIDEFGWSVCHKNYIIIICFQSHVAYIART